MRHLMLSMSAILLGCTAQAGDTAAAAGKGDSAAAHAPIDWTRVDSAVEAPGFLTSTAYWRKSGRRRSLSISPPFA